MPLSFSMTLRIAAFRSCLAAANFATIPARIRRALQPPPANQTRQGINAEPDKKRRGSSDLPSRCYDNLALESRSCAASSVTTWSWFVTW
jgi:hypothetical protein